MPQHASPEAISGGDHLEDRAGLLLRARPLRDRLVHLGIEGRSQRLDRLQPFKDNVDRHEKNVEALRRELGNLFR